MDFRSRFPASASPVRDWIAAIKQSFLPSEVEDQTIQVQLGFDSQKVELSRVTGMSYEATGPRSIAFHYKNGSSMCLSHAVYDTCVCSSCNCTQGLVEMKLEHKLLHESIGDCRSWYAKIDAAIRLYTSGLRTEILIAKVKCCSLPSAAEFSHPSLSWPSDISTDSDGTIVSNRRRATESKYNPSAAVDQEVCDHVCGAGGVVDVHK